MAVVYILRNPAGKLYIGSTDNLNRRLLQHRSGTTPSTKRLGAEELVFSQEYPSLLEARRIEMKLKRFKRKDFIEKIIKEGYIKASVRRDSSVSRARP
ncbi:MAG TPA: GIY-YIG nuclease family protein [Candidatus Paceibacterota bacterium]